MLIAAEDIIKLIPQRKPMVMIDCLLEIDQDSCSTNLIIQEDNIFCADGYFQEPGLIENIAQTAAAKMGYEYFISQKVPPLGFIAAIKDLKILHLPKIGSQIKTTIKITNQIANISIIEGETWQNETLLAKAELKVLIKNEQ